MQNKNYVTVKKSVLARVLLHLGCSLYY